MRFAEPWFLYALPAVWLVLGVAWWLSRRRRQALLRRFVGQEAGAWADTGHCAKRRAFEAVSGLVAVSALIVTLARPLYFEFNEGSELQGTPYLIALDASRSMLATDVRPSRYSAATNALHQFLAETKADRIGLITFAGIGYLNAPLTPDTTALQTILGYINPDALVDPGSSISSAIDRAARFFASNAVPQRTLVVISDGEDLDGQAVALARKLHRSHGLNIHTIGVGTATGARIPAFRGGTVTNASGNEVTTKLDENSLRRIANAAGGQFYRLGENGEGLRQLREEVLRPLAEKAARQELENYREGFFVPLGLALMALVAKLLSGADRFVRRRPLPGILQVKV